ncbi:MAG: alpha/beta hydrolase [Ruminococcaceae bacterium]|jgi:acetyl esterase/lipase|nr:alpha/beta hydrolase [Oscillospiraceae bacterium]
MALSKPMRYAIAALTRGTEKVDIKEKYELVRQLTRATHPQLLKPSYRPWDHTIQCGDHEVPVRIFTPDGEKRRPGSLLLFFHGGGWVTGDIDSYSDSCIMMTRMTGCSVVSVDYRLAPEYRFPAGLEDCYAAAQMILQNADTFGSFPEQVTLIGDSAGGNLAAAVSLLARERGGIVPSRQILLYPSTYNDHNPETSPFESVRSNGQGNMLTAQRIEDYMALYRSNEADLQNPYFAPLLAQDLSGQPETLVLTAEFDPLRDEGEEYGRRLANAGSRTFIYRVPDCLHGFISLPGLPAPVREAYRHINEFLDRAKTEPPTKSAVDTGDC